MANYTYIIRTDTKNEFLTIYNDVILKYSFPMSLNITNVLSSDDKKNIINDEYNIVKSLIRQITKRTSSSSSSRKRYDNNYNIIILPRIIYDLFFMMYYGIDNIGTNVTSHLFDIELDTYEKYCFKTNLYHQEISEQVYTLNQYILEHLDRIYFDYNSPNYIEYEKVVRYILNSMIMYSGQGAIRQITSIYKNNFTEINSIVNDSIHLIIIPKRIKNPSLFNLTGFANTIKMMLEPLHPHSNILFFTSVIIVRIIQDSLINTFKSINKLPGITDGEKVQMAIDEFMIIFNDTERVEEIIRNPEIYNSYPLSDFMNKLDDALILRCVKIESVEGSGKKNNFVLYRGSVDAIEGAVYTHRIPEKKVKVGSEYNIVPASVEDREGYSVSYNTSLLNGYFTDTTACTYNFMAGDETDDKYKHYYSMRKFNYNDNSDVSNMFFIPPLHPFLQLSSRGEFWHARSKIFIGSQIKGLGEFAGIFSGTEGSVGYSNLFPDYLISNLVNKRNRRSLTDGSSKISEISARNKAFIKIKFNKFIKAHRHSIVPLSRNIVKNKTYKTTTTRGTRGNKQMDENDDKNWHPEGELFGGMKKTRKNRRTKRRKY